MQKQLAFLLLCLGVSPVCAMKKPAERMYPLLEVTQISEPKFSQAQEEQAPLLSHDALTTHSVYPSHLLQIDESCEPNYPTHITMQESEEELQSLSKLLTLEKETLSTLKRRFPHALKSLNSKRCDENIQSNATVGGIGFCYYMTIFVLQICGDPRLGEDHGNNWSIAPVTYNMLGWMGSQGFAMSQCLCRKTDPDDNN